MGKCIKITAANEISIVDVDFDKIEQIFTELNCECFELVSTLTLTSFFYEKVVMLVDESFLFKDLGVNLVGSMFYGSTSPILGDILLCVRKDYDLVGFDDVYAAYSQIVMTWPLLLQEMEV